MWIPADPQMSTHHKRDGERRQPAVTVTTLIFYPARQMSFFSRSLCFVSLFPWKKENPSVSIILQPAPNKCFHPPVDVPIDSERNRVRDVRPRTREADAWIFDRCVGATGDGGGGSRRQMNSKQIQFRFMQTHFGERSARPYSQPLRACCTSRVMVSPLEKGSRVRLELAGWWATRALMVLPPAGRPPPMGEGAAEKLISELIKASVMWQRGAGRIRRGVGLW